MAKGQRQAANAQLATTNAAAAGEGANSSKVFGTVEPMYANLAKNGGYDDKTKAAIVNSGVGAANSVFGSAADAVRTGAAASKNNAGEDVTLDSMARQKAIADANASQNAQVTIANDAQQQQQEGRQGLSQLFGTTTGSMDSLYSNGPGTLNARAAGGNFLQNTLAPIGGAVGAALGSFG